MKQNGATLLLFLLLSLSVSLASSNFIREKEEEVKDVQEEEVDEAKEAEEKCMSIWL